MSALLRRWLAATTRADRVVLALVLLLVAGTDLVPRLYFWLDPVADNRSRYTVAVFADRAPGSLLGIWADADDVEIDSLPLCELPPGMRPPRPIAERWLERDGEPVRLVVFPSRASLPHDRWGNPFFLLIGFGRRGPCEVRSLSAGPNGTLDWGAADDIDVGSGHMGMTRAWWPLAFLGALLGLPYLSARLSSRKRASTLAGELAVTTAVAAPAMLIVFFVIERGFQALDQLTLGAWLLVPPRVAIGGSLAAAVWGLVLVRRLRRLPPVGTDHEAARVE